MEPLRIGRKRPSELEGGGSSQDWRENAEGLSRRRSPVRPYLYCGYHRGGGGLDGRQETQQAFGGPNHYPEAARVHVGTASANPMQQRWGKGAVARLPQPTLPNWSPSADGQRQTLAPHLRSGVMLSPWHMGVTPTKGNRKG